MFVLPVFCDFIPPWSAAPGSTSLHRIRCLRARPVATSRTTSLLLLMVTAWFWHSSIPLSLSRNAVEVYSFTVFFGEHCASGRETNERGNVYRHVPINQSNTMTKQRYSSQSVNQSIDRWKQMVNKWMELKFYLTCFHSILRGLFGVN